MPEQAGGGTRFARAGSLWKTSWKGKVPFSESCCISGFSGALGGNYYVDAAVLPGSTGTGFFVGAVVGLEVVPAGSNVIARSGNLIDEGWTLEILPGGQPNEVSFRFTVGNGFGVAAQVDESVFITNVGQPAGPEIVFVSVLAGLTTAVGDPPDGAAFIVVSNTTGAGSGAFFSAQVLNAPYLNSTPSLRVGIGGIPGTQFAAPNCIQGIVGGTAPWVSGGGGTSITPVFRAWNALNADTSVAPTQIQPVPEAAVPIGIVNTNGWRSPTTPGAAPDPLPPFIGAVDLTYALDPNFPLAVGCHSPTVFYPANLLLPYTAISP